MRNKYTWRYMNDISFSNSLFRDLGFFISYSSMIRSFIILLVVGNFLFACDGCPIMLQSSPCLCSCYDMLTLCQDRCNTMTDSGRRSRCMSSCAENVKVLQQKLSASARLSHEWSRDLKRETADFTHSWK